jgi:hypothetical protein
LARELIVVIDDELEREMRKYPEVDWIDIIHKSLRECIHRKEIAKVYTAAVERAMLQEK